VAASEYALECRHVTVRFGSVVALSDVSLAFPRGAIHAVVGQNGAGKTTFGRVAAGLVRPTEGSIFIDGTNVKTGRVREARTAGVELVHQSFALPPSFSVAEAMEFGASGAGRLFTRRGLRKRWSTHLRELGVNVDPGARIRDLSVEQHQGIEIARALVADAKVLILDEPTAVLSPAGVEQLFERVRMLRQRGVTVIIILHKAREVLAIADTVTVLRAGKLVSVTQPVAGIDAARLSEMVIGDAASRPPGISGEPAPALPGEPVLAMSAVSTIADPEGPGLAELSLTIRAGEIVGVAGVEGNGQRTLVRTIATLTQRRRGTIHLAGADMTGADLATRRQRGLRIIPFERNVEGLSLTNSLWENWSARVLLARSLLAPITPGALRRACEASLRAWNVRFASTAQPAGALSGGNAQKVILAREIDEGAKLIVAAQPTRGLDIGASAAVWSALRTARGQGSGILLISSDLDELFENSDRLVVMLSGGIVAEFAAPYEIGTVGAAMTGART
jgi:general nucleoside transport system ATP-binding protein